VIHATNDTRDLNKNYRTEIGILGDAKLVLRALADCVRDRLRGAQRDAQNNDGMATKIAGLRDPWLAEWHAKLNSAEVPMMPYRVINASG
jgi:acetolactate synthase I/II/III large subunit